MSSGREQGPEYQSKEEWLEDNDVDETDDCDCEESEMYDEDYNEETGQYYEDDIEAEPPPDMSAKFPNIHVKLIGRDGNAFAILGAVRKELRRGSVSDDVIQEFVDEATSGDYNHLLATCMRWVSVE